MITKEQIIAVTTQLFLKNGVKFVTTEEITRELRTSKRSIYSHFSDKTDLMEACIKSYLADIRSNNDQMISNSGNAIEALGNIHQQILKRNSYANSTFYKDIVKYYPGILKEYYQQNWEKAFRELLAIAKWGIKEGYFREDLDPEVTMKTVQDLIMLCRNTSKFPSPEFSQNRLTKGIMIPYLRGLCTAKGVQEVDKQVKLFLNKE